MGFIYTLTSPSDKKYVGQTIRTLEERLDKHKRLNSHCTALKNAIQKYGWNNFIVDYYECPDDELNKHERWLVELMGTLAPGGYNLKEGGGSRGKASEETKKKMSEAQSGENNPMWGIPKSQETKDKLREANLGEKNPNYGKTGENHHNYGRKCAQETKDKMSIALSGEKNPNYGRTGDKHPNSKRVYQYTLDEIYIDDFSTSKEAAQKLGREDGSVIAKCARGKISKAYGFKWSYELI
ncbi:GIY-YIG catalytic domain-containing endonuclease [Paramecium bursaria Chlorella virus NYs1]|uniref:GIY-YIG catalytic domain-containing endonuclease n=1 Tax=Paramecium bursaria Chlorella virus NYs1 TaxID=83442 RepID=M1HHF2_9PHYC|nr:GIY-YIG catalytic domain-containing endonuclease [Paramecium bursaria Chlorella virus NYs1]AGE58738.1 GIY-YIG catalytic domain-containing endonuclease [Paramecium bursaria Chlorella virus NYs1]